MRVGFDAKRATMNFTGLGNYCRSVIQQLGKSFPENHYLLFTPRLKNPERYSEILKGKPFFIRVPGKGFPSFLSWFWRTFLINGIIQREKLDLFHGLSGELPLGKKPRNTGFILTIHDLIFFRYPRYYKALDRWFYKIKSRYAVQKADHIIAISEQTRKDIVEFLKVDPGKITVIYQDCDPSFYKKIAPSDLEFIRENYSLPKKYILYVGTLEPRKRSLELIKAFHILKRDYLSTIELVLVGKKTDYFMELLSYIRENQLDRCIHFYHDISFLDLPGFYQMAELFIYPSTFEGFGLPILEALVSGVPVITSQGSCFSEAGGEGSIYLNPENSAYFAETIHEILNNKSLQNKMKLKGLEHSRKFEAKGLANQLMEVYKSTIN